MLLSERAVEVFIIKKSSMTAIKIEGLQVTFDIEKKLETGKEGSNTANVYIYNLSKTTRNRLEDAGQALLLKAGYKNDAGSEVIFKGDIDLISHKYSAPNIITHVECIDKSNLSAKMSLSFKAGTNAKDILKQLTSLAGLDVMSEAGISGLVDQVFNNGFSHSGTALTALNKVTAKMQAQWSLQNGQLKFTKNGSTDQKQAVVLSPATGLLDSPEKEFHAVKKNESTEFEDVASTVENKKPIIKVHALLQPKIEPGNAVKIESREFNALYRVMSVKHTGEFMGQPWNTDLECEDVYVKR